jgi:hypothetical protein
MGDDNYNGSNVIHLLPSPSPPPPMPPRPPPPVVEVVRIRDPRGDLLVVPRCPHCSRPHTHGLGPQKGPGAHGHRQSHCLSGPWNPNVGYYLHEPCPSATAAKPKASARPRRRRAKREVRDFRRETDPHVRAALFRKLLVQHGFTHKQVDIVIAHGLAALDESRFPDPMR